VILLLQSDGSVKFGDQKLSANQWGLKVTKFSAIQIYNYAENQEGELLSELPAVVCPPIELMATVPLA